MKNKFKINDIVGLNKLFDSGSYGGIKCKIISLRSNGNVTLEVLKSPNINYNNNFPVGYQFNSNLDIWQLTEVILIKEDGEYEG